MKNKKGPNKADKEKAGLLEKIHCSVNLNRTLYLSSGLQVSRWHQADSHLDDFCGLIDEYPFNTLPQCYKLFLW